MVLSFACSFACSSVIREIKEKAATRKKTIVLCEGEDKRVVEAAAKITDFLEQAKKASGCDALLCIMSGSFTQRGEMCILDKFTRAKHAILGGAPNLFA